MIIRFLQVDDTRPCARDVPRPALDVELTLDFRAHRRRRSCRCCNPRRFSLPSYWRQARSRWLLPGMRVADPVDWGRCMDRAPAIIQPSLRWFAITAGLGPGPIPSPRVADIDGARSIATFAITGRRRRFLAMAIFAESGNGLIDPMGSVSRCTKAAEISWATPPQTPQIAGSAGTSIPCLRFAGCTVGGPVFP